MSISSSLPSSMTSGPPAWVLTDQDVAQGCILWLGSERETICSSSKRSNMERFPVVNMKTQQPANPGMFGHPIIVISRSASHPDTIHFHQITSFAGKTLEERCAGRKAAFRQQTFCPIAPAPDHPQLVTSNGRYRTLTFDNNDSLEKPSYVNIREVYQMNWHDAQPYWGTDSHTRKMWRLDAKSVASLSRLTMSSTGFRAETQFRPSPSTPVRGRGVAKELESLMPTSLQGTTSEQNSQKPEATGTPSMGNFRYVPTHRAMLKAHERKEPLLPVFRGDELKTHGDRNRFDYLATLLVWLEDIRIWTLFILMFRHAA